MAAEFTKEMKKDHVILIPDIFPMHMDLIKEIFAMYGYNVKVLRSRGKQVIDCGLQHMHNDMCYPAICVVGQQIHALTSGEYDTHKIALLQFQTGGGCRASNYIWLLRRALDNMGMGYVPVVSLSFSGMEKGSGFSLTPMMLFKGLMAVVYGDMLMLLKNQVKPYEKNKGETLALVERWNKELISQFRKNKGLVGKGLRSNLRAIVSDFSRIERTHQQKVKVGIVGEIYVKYSPFGNNGLEEFLESQDCEYMVPGVLAFVQYCFANIGIDYDIYGGKKSAKRIGVLSERLIGRLERAMLDALEPYPEFTAPSKFEDTKKMADRVLDRGVKMGEGWLLSAEMGELIENGYSNIVCAQPFGCLPNHIVGKGVIRTFKELFPSSNICPVDYDPGASKVNQENRIKLMLAVARENIASAKEKEIEKEGAAV